MTPTDLRVPVCGMLPLCSGLRGMSKGLVLALRKYYFIARGSSREDPYFTSGTNFPKILLTFVGLASYLETTAVRVPWNAGIRPPAARGVPPPRAFPQYLREVCKPVSPDPWLPMPAPDPTRLGFPRRLHRRGAHEPAPVFMTANRWMPLNQAWRFHGRIPRVHGT